MDQLLEASRSREKEGTFGLIFGRQITVPDGENRELEQGAPSLILDMAVIDIKTLMKSFIIDF